jgi:hypothetical protein
MFVVVFRFFPDFFRLLLKRRFLDPRRLFQQWLREVKLALGSMVISEFWSFWRKIEDASSKNVKDIVLDDAWWERVYLTIKVMDPIISLL